jgi:hypothetical protein
MMRLAAAFAIALILSVVHADPIVLSDIEDIIQHNLTALPDSKYINLAKSSESFLPNGEQYQFGLHLTGALQATDNGHVYPATALLNDTEGNETHFKASTGLLDRMVVLEDVSNGITLAFPLAVGGVDPAIVVSHYRILTPLYSNATLHREDIIPHRTSPTYYRNLPFMPLTNPQGVKTAIAFHITILTDDDFATHGLNFLRRGFESHGCMRLREKDLLQFFAIMTQGGDDQIPVTVQNYVWNINDQGVRDSSLGAAPYVHTYPFNMESFERVKYFPDAPHYQRDPVENLIILEVAQGQPDFSQFPQME